MKNLKFEIYNLKFAISRAMGLILNPDKPSLLITHYSLLIPKKSGKEKSWIEMEF